MSQGGFTLTTEIEETLPFTELYTNLSGLEYIETKSAPLRPIFKAQLSLAAELGCINDQLRERGNVTEERAAEFRQHLKNILCAQEDLEAGLKSLDVLGEELDCSGQVLDTAEKVLIVGKRSLRLRKMPRT